MGMCNKIAAVFAAGAVLILFSACGAGLVPPQPLPDVSYNGFLGLAVTVPAGWLTEYKNLRNLTPVPEESESLSSLDLSGNSDQSVFEIKLITMQNVDDSSRSDHVEIILYADYAPDYSEEDYLSSLEIFIQELSDAEYLYEIASVGEALISGHRFTRFLVEVTPFYMHGEDFYYEEYYVVPVGRSYFVAYTNYWGRNEGYKSNVAETLSSCFALKATGSGRAVPNNAAEAL